MQQGTASWYEHESTTTLHKKYKVIPASLFVCIKHTPNTSSTNRSKIFYKIPDYFCPTLDST
jgi:hypothetical protein